MFQFIARRLFYGLLVLWGVITIVFVLFNVLPGDPARMMLGQRADISSVELINKELGLDKPLIVQYGAYLNDLSFISLYESRDKGSFFYYSKEKYPSSLSLFEIGGKTVVLKEPFLRRSYQSKREVSSILAEAFPQTALLAFVSMLVAFVLGVAIGIGAAIWKDSWFDKISLVLSVFGMSLPSFFAAILVAWLFAFVLADYTGLNMVGNMYEVDDFGRGEFLNLKNLILPVITLAMRPLAVLVGLTKNSVLDVLSQDYIRTAKAKGLSSFRIIRKHVLRNALNPVITAASGWFASLMAGAVFIEYVFDWKGIGVAMVDALDKYDFPVVMGALLFISIILLVINIIVDILYGYLDPRVRY